MTDRSDRPAIRPRLAPSPVRFRGRDRQGRRRHDRAPVRRRPHPQGRPPHRGLRHDRRGRRRARARPRRAPMKEPTAPVAGLGGLGDTILRFQRELFVVGRGAGDEPRGLGPTAAGRRDPRLGQAMVAAMDDHAARGSRPRSRCRASSSCPGRRRVSAALELARTTPPPRRAPRRDARRGRGRDCRWPYPTVSEPPRGPPVGPRPGGRTGRGAGSHRRPAGPHPRAPSRRIDDRARTGAHQHEPEPPHPVPASASRPARGAGPAAA